MPASVSCSTAPGRRAAHPRSPNPDPSPVRRATTLTLLVLTACLLPCQLLRAQDAPSNEDLKRQLAEALARIAALTQRVEALEAGQKPNTEDDLEAQLQALLGEEPPAAVPPRTVVPSATNPTISVFVDSVTEAGNAQEKLGTNGDRFSLRETELDFRLPISPFAEGVAVATFEDEGSGQFGVGIEEGYADITLSELLDVDTLAKLKVGRFRAPFGRENKLHTHDQALVDRAFAVTRQLGPEGLIGDGLEATLPLYSNGAELGNGQTFNAQVAMVNGEMLTSPDGILGSLATNAGLTLSSDAPMAVGRVSSYTELGTLSDIEFGASMAAPVGSRAVMTSAGGNIDSKIYGLDATWRQRDDESGQGSWLVMAEAIRSDTNFGGPATPGFPNGKDRSNGWWITTQRQTSPTTYVGLRVGQTDVLGTDGADSILDLSPYVSWYADEFFRLRLQGEHLESDTSTGNASVNRAFLEATWNFGTHQPHPYWTNK